jgi:hypothetical protein
MRRFDALAITIGFFLAGGLIYLLLQFAGLDSAKAGIWSQAILFTGVVGWLLTYLFRVGTKNMTYNQQVKDYKEAVLQKALDELTPEQLEKLQAEIEEEKRSKAQQQ